jgi:hypothetical protein
MSLTAESREQDIPAMVKKRRRGLVPSPPPERHPPGLPEQGHWELYRPPSPHPAREGPPSEAQPRSQTARLDPRPPSDPGQDGHDHVGWRDDLKWQFERLKTQVRERREKRTQPQKSVPIHLYENHLDQRMDIGDLLRQVDMLPMKFGQFVDVARSFKADIARLLQLSTKPEYQQRREPSGLRSVVAIPEEVRPIPACAVATSNGETIRTIVANTQFMDVAQVDDGKTYLGYITAQIDGRNIHRVLVDYGSLAKLVGESFADQIGLVKLRLQDQSLCLRLANDSTSPVTHYVKFPLVVSGILSIVNAYVAGNSRSYDLLLGKGWLRQNHARVDFATDEMTITSKQGHTYVTKMGQAEPHSTEFLVPNNQPIHNPLVRNEMSDESDDSDNEDDDFLLADLLHVAQSFTDLATTSKN